LKIVIKYEISKIGDRLPGWRAVGSTRGVMSLRAPLRNSFKSRW
jgi:hypothetical protein